MNILILTGRFGMGHIKAAEAIKEQIITENPSCNVEIIDFIEYMFPAISKGIYRGFNFLVSRCSGLYNAINKAAGKNSGVPMKLTFTKRIDRLLEEHKADAVVVAFPVCSQYISSYKRMRRSSIPLYTYITDITAHEEWIAPGTDKYFVGDITTKNALLSKGVSEDKIAVSGIPVRRAFYGIGKEEVSEKEGKKEVLIMGGGLGLIPSSERFLHRLSARSDIRVTVITGKNEKLRRELSEKFPKLNIIGYTEHVDRYMQRADLLVTKAGGITTFEAIASETPIYIIKPFLEQEFGNAKYIEGHNIGRVLWDVNADEASDILRLIDDNSLLNTMKKNMAHISSGIKNFRLTEEIA